MNYGKANAAKMLSIARKYHGEALDEYITTTCDEQVQSVFSPLRTNLLNWYPFQSDCVILEINAGMGALTGMLCERAKSVTALEASPEQVSVIVERYGDAPKLTVIQGDILSYEPAEPFDYVVLASGLASVGMLMKSSDPFQAFLTRIMGFLKKGGILLCAMENRFGLTYWNGAVEPYLQKPFAGIRGYRGTERTFSKSELEALLFSAGFAQIRFYYPTPNLEAPCCVFTDEHIPHYSDFSRFPRETDNVNRKRRMLFDEAALYQDIIENNVFPFFSNAFIVEASLAELPKEHIVFASMRTGRTPLERTLTTISSGGAVVKSPADNRTVPHMKSMYDHYRQLLQRGVGMLPCEFDGRSLRMPYHQGKNAHDIFCEEIANGHFERACHLLDLLREAIEKSTNIADGIAKNAFWDMTLFNAFLQEDTLLFFDQEWVMTNLPCRYLLFREVFYAFLGKNAPHERALYQRLLEHVGAWDKEKEYMALEARIQDSFAERKSIYMASRPYYTENLKQNFKAFLKSRSGRTIQWIKTVLRWLGKIK